METTRMDLLQYVSFSLTGPAAQRHPQNPQNKAKFAARPRTFVPMFLSILFPFSGLPPFDGQPTFICFRTRTHGMSVF